MKKYINLLLTGSLLTFSISSCTDMKIENQIITDNTIEIGLSGESPISKSFVEGDELGLYLVSSTTAGPKDLSATRNLNNVKFTMVGRKFISNPASSFPEDENMLNSIFVYHPYNELSVDNGKKDMIVKVNYDQRSNLSANDLIYCVKHDYKPEILNLSLDLKHALSKVNIRLKAGKGYNSLKELGNPSILIMDNIQEGVFDFSNVVPSSTYPRYDMYPNGFFVEKDGVLTGVSAILIPQTISTGNVFIKLIINEQEYTYIPAKDLVLEMGKENTFTLTINKGFDGVSVAMNDLSIVDWDVESFDYDLDEMTKPEGNTITDIDGNVYDIVQIGEQFWMESNLRVTKLNDGTVIKKNEKKLSEWTTYTEPAYVAYNFDEANVEKYGYLYNKKSVYTEKICPKGWDVASSNDWDVLAKFLGGVVDNTHCWKGVGKALKSTEWAPGTNSSGFNALPGGLLFAMSSAPENTQFQGFSTSSDWWSSTGNFTRSLTGKNNLDRYMTSEVSGASIRCIYNRKPIK